MAVLLALAVAAVGCGGDDNEGSSGGDKSYNATDAAFASSMLAHHTGGVELGKLAQSRGTDPEVRRLGKGIVEEQTREMKTLEGFVRDFGAKDSTMSAAIEERGMADIAALRAASESEFDEMWLAVISGHHGAAIQMAGIEAEGGESTEARDLARSIVESQSAELMKFNQLLAAP